MNYKLSFSLSAGHPLKKALTWASFFFVTFLLLSGSNVYQGEISPLARAAPSTYYMSPDGNDVNSGSQTQPFATFKKAFSTMKGGDLLIVVDGTYTQDLGEWKWSGGVKVPTIAPPSGSAGNYTTIKSQNIRSIISDIEIVGSSYIRIEGFKSLSPVTVDGSNHIELKKIGAKGGIQTNRSSYVTKEDVWAWNDNRYVIHNYQSDHVIDNRVIARLDDTGGPAKLPVGAISHYLTNYSVIANALLFDVSGTFQQPYDLVYSSRPGIGFDQLWGIIGFNAGTQLGGIYPGDGSGSNYEIHNSVIWGTSKRCIHFNSSAPLKVFNSTCGKNGGETILNNDSPVEIKNNIFFQNSKGVAGGVGTCDNNVFYQSGSVPAKCTNSTDSDPAVKWLPRSPVPGKGATIEKRYSISESNGKFAVTESDQNLWPWPYEDLIKQDLCENTAKGWCGTNKTLTQYVWEYLGNPCPSDVCGDGGGEQKDIVAPSIPAGVTGSAVSPTQVNVSWQASTDNTGVAGYKVFRNGSQIAVSTSTSYADSGLSPNTAYTYTVSAYDAAENNSGQSSGGVVTTPGLAGGECAKANILCVDDTSGSTSEYLTIQAAVNAAKAGDTVLVHDGNYTGFQIAISGSQGAPVVFKANGSEAVINTGYVSGDGIYIKNASYITIDGLKIQNVSQRCVAARDAAAASPMKGIIVKNITCTGAGKEGMYLSQVSSSLVENNTISNSGSSGLGKSHGIYLANGGSDDTIIRSNKISGAAGSGSEGVNVNGDISIGGDGLITGLVIEKNTIFDNANNALNFDGVQNASVSNNLIYNNGRHALRAYKIDGAQGPKNLKIINNTILVKSSGGWAVKISNDLGEHVIFNNILLNENTSNGSISAGNPNFFSNYNGLVNKFSLDNETTKIDLTAWQAKGYDKNSFLSSASALFVNPAAGGYELKAGSPAINTGAQTLAGVPAPSSDIKNSVRPYGASYDAGAYEYLQPDQENNPPVIANIAVTPLASGATVTWSTNEPATSKVEYGATGAYGSATSENTALKTSHSAALTGLAPNTIYHYRVISKDSAGKESVSSDQTFTTLFLYKSSDLNKDKSVDNNDLTVLRQEFGRTDKPVSDINQDGIVDSRDVGIMMSEWGK